MNNTVIAKHLKNLDHRLTRVEQILPTLATKQDLGVFSTKDDLNAFATKDDLKAFATKDDLKAFATKDDLNAFATKEDLNAFATKEDLRSGLDRLRLDVQILLEHQDGKIQLLAEHLLAIKTKLGV